MAKYITHIDVSLDASGEVPITSLQITFNDEMAVGLVNAGYTKIDKDLNAGAGGDIIYLWYFRGSDRKFHTPIVELKVTTDAESEARNFNHGWERLACDLNRWIEGNWIHFWVKREKQSYIGEITATDSC